MYALPSARKIRVEAFPTGQVENALFNVNSMQWGQFLTHDMSLQEEPNTGMCCIFQLSYHFEILRMLNLRFWYRIRVLHGGSKV